MHLTCSILFAGVALAARPTCAFSSVKTLTLIRGARTIDTSVYSALKGNEGCAAKPYEKKKIAVFGAGGYLGATVFGFLQRAASIYGTGISGGSSPRAIGATRTTSEALNKVLTPCFKLAYAGEDLVRLVDSTNKDYIKERLKSFDAAILGTVYQLEQRSVTGNTYEKTPNDKTFEFYLDERYGARGGGVPRDCSDYHISMFESAIQACKESGSIKHVVVLETPRTPRPRDFISILEREGISYTYIRANSLKKDLTYSFEKGVKEKLTVALLSEVSRIPPHTDEPNNGEKAVFREDIAALIVQCLMSLNWEESRIIEVSATSETISSNSLTEKKSKQRFDKEWCPNSNVYAEMLVNLK
ncbi:hypothetical protein HJC23_001460 [Cyclotella cryptica]|uniref:NAD(P)-binding domain-containing protein n=1 Tax=Cyclotella cryptica TaxID=29204 RepID=A0ABD3PAT1_9STRA|eukprot:CCRYP_016162-RA/>CCRYP_016162-RA protein AED:0.35 eAED:0.35 QI:96/1/1/1/1/1/3/869/357